MKDFTTLPSDFYNSIIEKCINRNCSECTISYKGLCALRELGAHAPCSWVRKSAKTEQEELEKDAHKPMSKYWKCYLDCQNCISKIDGCKPYEHYGVGDCGHAMNLDLLRRQRELDGKE